jgi:hypothetical protein
MGSYDDQPGDGSFLSQYKNLFHHYVHQTGKEEATTFWSGCGAVRRELFLMLGGFNEGYKKACIEDIELGFRLRRAGFRIRLEKTVQVKHLKRWQFVSLVKTDLFLRGVPWVALMLRDRRMVKDLNLTWHARVCTMLAYLLVLGMIALGTVGHPLATLPVLGLVGFGCLSAILHDRVSRRRWQAVSSAGLVAVMAAAGSATSIDPAALVPLAVLGTILAIHGHFYRFFIHTRGLHFASAMIPFHLLFFLYSGLAIPLGALAYLHDSREARRRQTGPGRTPCAPLRSEAADTPQVLPIGSSMPSS